MTRVSNMQSPGTGRDVPNQFLITGAHIIMPDDEYTGTVFQSYDSVIVFKAHECGNTGNIYRIFLDEKYWDYSKTTGTYRNQFLGEGIAKTRKKTKSGEYILTDLN